jgi:hypothetical protein
LCIAHDMLGLVTNAEVQRDQVNINF